MLPELKLTQLRYVVLIAELRSFHGAARQSFRTQPALSLAVRELEQKLGQPLFEKGGRAELTPFGEHCLPLFRDLLDHHDRIAREVTLLARHEIGQVSIATVPSVASRLLPHLLAR
ncbi:MAG: LysR family transcriptional regulator, partial [Burkholderiales bacterium]